MPTKKRERRCCRWCQRPVEECGSLSARGSCLDCSKARMAAAHDAAPRQMGSSEYLRRWRRGMAAAIGAKLPEGW